MRYWSRFHRGRDGTHSPASRRFCGLLLHPGVTKVDCRSCQVVRVPLRHVADVENIRSLQVFFAERARAAYDREVTTKANGVPRSIALLKMSEPWLIEEHELTLIGVAAHVCQVYGIIGTWTAAFATFVCAVKQVFSCPSSSTVKITLHKASKRYRSRRSR